MDLISRKHPWLHSYNEDPWDIKLLGVYPSSKGDLRVCISERSYDHLWKVEIDQIVDQVSNQNIYRTYVVKIVKEDEIEGVLDKYVVS